MEKWADDFDAACVALVESVCDDTATRAARDAAWKRLLVGIVPHVERWAGNNALLRRCRLASADDARTVLVDVLERMSKDDFANLRAFLAKRELPASKIEETVALERAARLASGPDADDAREVRPARADPLRFRPWILTLLRFAAADHVQARLGCAPANGTTERAPTKRDLGTDAPRLDAVPERGERPPITDLMTFRRLLADVSAHLESFPREMRAAFAMWLEDVSFDEIAARLSLSGPEDARATVRAAQARLRHRFRERWPELPAAV